MMSKMLRAELSNGGDVLDNSFKESGGLSHLQHTLEIVNDELEGGGERRRSRKEEVGREVEEKEG